MNAPCSKLNRLKKKVINDQEVLIPELTPRLAFKKMCKFGIPCYDHKTMRWYRMSETNPNNIKTGNFERYSDKEGKFVPCNFQWETIIANGIWYQGMFKKQKKEKAPKAKRITKDTVCKFLAEAKKQLGDTIFEAISLVCQNRVVEFKAETAESLLKSDVVTRKPFTRKINHV